MCWIGNIKHKHVAKKDIEVRKMLMKGREEVFENPFLVSPYQVTKYDINVLYGTKINPHHSFPKHDPGYITIDVGIHCYSASKCRFVRRTNSTSMITVYLHCDSKNLADQCKHTTCYPGDRLHYPVLMKAIIPAGTTYYENKRGEIVSEKLIIKDIDNKL